ncbi:MAG TPA: hypothetical protein VIL36_16200 [Acidimicrobiales bacterium]
MTQTEELSLASLDAIEEPPTPPTRPRGKHGWWWPLALGGAVCTLAGAAAGYLLAPGDDADPPATDPAPAQPELVIAPGSFLGPISGATDYRPTAADRTNRYDFAWPGQELEAPAASTGDPVAYQWELCDVPPEPETEEEAAEPVALECDPVEGATEATFTSPPTDRTRLVRVVVTVDLGNDVLVDAASVPVAALAWPETVQPGEAPPGARPEVPAVRD